MPIPLKFTTSLDDSNFMQGLASMDKAAMSFSKGLTIGTAVLAGLATVGNASIQAASAIADASAAANIAGEDFQRLSFAFGQSGTKVEQFTVGLQTLTTSIQEAADGNDKTIRSFERLGISIDDLKGADTKEILLQIADGMKDSTNKAESMTAALDLLGKGGKKMVAGLQEGRAAIEGIGASARIISERDLKTLDETGDRIARTWQGLKASVAGVVASVLRGPFSFEGGKTNPAIQAAEEEGDKREEREAELEAEKEKNWRRALDRVDYEYKNKKAAETELAKIKEAADREQAEIRKGILEDGARAEEYLAQKRDDNYLKSRRQVIEVLEKAQDASNAKLDAAQRRRDAARVAAEDALKNGVRGGLQTPAERRAEAMAEKRVAREERRLERILANPQARIGGKTGDAERAKNLRDARREVAAANNQVTLAQKSVDAIVTAIEKLVTKP